MTQNHILRKPPCNSENSVFELLRCKDFKTGPSSHILRKENSAKMSILQTCLARKNEVGASAVLQSADQLTRKTLMENVDSDGLNALHYAAYYGCHKTLKLMLDDISQHELPGEISRIFTEKDKNSFQNILHYAASEGQVACVELILKHVQDKHEIKNELLQAMMSPSGNQPIQGGFEKMS